MTHERVIERIYDQVFTKMSPERRARNLSAVKALARKSVRVKNKENEDPLNNNLALSYHMMHSTPIKSQKVTDLDVIESGSQTDETETPEMEDTSYQMDGREDFDDLESLPEYTEEEPELVIAKIYDLLPGQNGTRHEGKEEYENEDEYRMAVEIVVPENGDSDEASPGKTTDEPAWKSLHVLDETAEFEFCKSLEQSKLYLSTSNLLEEIEADLPSTYSLARPFSHTFHSLMSYRTITRLARLDKTSACVNVLENGDTMDVDVPHKKLDFLEMEAMVQKVKAKQAEKALDLSRAKKAMEIENFESEKTLLLANLRYNAAVQEIEKFKVLGDVTDRENYGQITIQEIIFSVDESVKNGTESFICTATERETVQCSSAFKKTPDGKLNFDEEFRFYNLSKDFVIYVKLFIRQSKEPKNPIKNCLMKKLKELTSVNPRKGITSNAPSQNHGFTCIACAELRLDQITKRVSPECTLRFTQTPQYPAKMNDVLTRVSTDFNTRTTKSGFLTVFKTTWQRRWYCQSGYFLNSWLYPEDQENEKSPIDCIYLPTCSDRIRLASMEDCIRQHSFIVPFGSDSGGLTLFAADSNKDAVKWVDHLNLVLEHIHLWKPTV